MKGMNTGASSVIFQGPSGPWAVAARSVAGSPSVSSFASSIENALVASSTLLVNFVESSASSSAMRSNRSLFSPTSPTPESSASRMPAETTRCSAMSSSRQPGPLFNATIALYSGSLCAMRIDVCTTSFCTASCAARSSGLLATPMRCWTMPQAV
jgi:hypothetical protein